MSRRALCPDCQVAHVNIRCPRDPLPELAVELTPYGPQVVIPDTPARTVPTGRRLAPTQQRDLKGLPLFAGPELEQLAIETPARRRRLLKVGDLVRIRDPYRAMRTCLNRDRGDGILYGAGGCVLPHGILERPAEVSMLGGNGVHRACIAWDAGRYAMWIDVDNLAPELPDSATRRL